MMPPSNTARSIATSIARTSFFRRRDPGAGRDGHREWVHFSIAEPDLMLLVNLSVVDDLRPASPPNREQGRVVVLVRDRHGWHGGVEEVAPDRLEVHGGQISATIGESRLETDGQGRFHLTACVSGAERCLIELTFSPTSFPSLASNVSLGAPDELLNWVVVPSLIADGTITLGERTIHVHRRPAYHDHNWGYFSHRNFTWEWGHASPRDHENPYSVVFTRLLDGAHTQSFMQALLLWREGRQHRVFREHEVEVSASGHFRPDSPRGFFTVPQSMSLLAGGSARTTDIPQRLSIHAHGYGDTVIASFEAIDTARIVVPNGHDLGTTLIHEVLGRFEMQGRIRDELVDFTGHAVFEFLGRGP